MKKLTTFVAICTVLSSGAAQAALTDRGGGLLYDDVLNITWLQDANYAKTSGYDADGLMNWGEANTWAANLTYAGYDDWRLPSTAPVGADWDYALSLIGSTDFAYNITSPHSELSYMHYVNLGLTGYWSPEGVYQPDLVGLLRNGIQGGQANVGPVHNLQSSVYWSGTADARYPTSYAWLFVTADGDQNFYSQNFEVHAWAVRPGDVAPIPEPETYAMFLAGLGLMGFMARRKQKETA